MYFFEEFPVLLFTQTGLYHIFYGSGHKAPITTTGLQS
jgi:hypothetical protein